jgi:hypothetical protein
MNNRANFYAEMLQHKQNLLDRRNRGESVGDHRGQLKPRADDWATRNMDAIELALFKATQSWNDALHGFEQDLHWIVLCLNDATIHEIPF